MFYFGYGVWHGIVATFVSAEEQKCGGERKKIQETILHIDVQE